MSNVNVYKVMFKNGTERTLTRQEDDGRSVIGLWIWCLKQYGPKVINFTECAVLASEIVAIDEAMSQEDFELQAVQDYERQERMEMFKRSENSYPANVTTEFADGEEPFRPEVSE